VVVVSGALPSDFPPIYSMSMTNSNLVGCKPVRRHCRLLRRHHERAFPKELWYCRRSMLGPGKGHEAYRDNGAKPKG
jgi:hypothetical protein